MRTVKDVATLFNVHTSTIKLWCKEFCDYLSSYAIPDAGKTRYFIDNDLLVFSLISEYWEESPDFESIRYMLNLDYHLDDKYREFMYIHTHIFQEPPEEINEDWQHGILINGLSSADSIGVARQYKNAGDALVVQALENYYPSELAYPIFFNYRHAIEIYLKTMIDFEFRVDKTHNLDKLKIDFQKKYGINLPVWIAEILNDFHVIDPASMTFRYASELPTKNKESEYWIDLYQLRTVMNFLCKSFETFIAKDI